MQRSNYPSFSAGKLLKIEGFNQSRLLNELMKEGVKIYDLKRFSASEMSFKVLKNSLSKTFAILEKMCYNYKVEKTLGFFHGLSSRLINFGLIIGLSTAIALYGLLSGFIWNIEVTGTKNLDPDMILKELKTVEVKTGSSKNSLDLRELEKYLRAMDGVSEVSCKTVGTTLSINILESLEYLPPSNGLNRSDIVSGYDATVTRYSTVSGDARVKVGQVVKKGDVLIAGEIMGTLGQILCETKARGKVHGNIVLKESMTVKTKGFDLVKTGNKKGYTALSLFGLRIGKDFDCGFEYFDTVKTADKLCLLPIKAEHISYEELVRQDFEMSLEEAEAKAEALLKEKIETRFKGDIVSQRFFMTKIDENTYTADYFVTAEIIIGEL